MKVNQIDISKDMKVSDLVAQFEASDVLGAGRVARATNILANMIKDDIKIKDLATLMDKSQSAASSIMRQENISLDSLKEICDALNYDLDIEIKKRQ